MTTYGLRLFDAGGNVVLEISDRITRFGGQIDTGTTNGSFAVPMFSTGDPWIHVRDSDPISSTVAPTVVKNGNVISWSFEASTYPKRSVRVLFGVY